ncbi:MAG: 4-phosphopantetheinyl transferase family protein [Deltaproteobacteria bacterium]|nr:4-phosphopantetheinyl transferase family protein [Deltaproteobacteria bacterium]
MIGNDVVDLGDAECLPGACHPRFDARVFCPSELALLSGSTEPDRTRWVLWAAKESAYKAARRLDPRTVFSPPRFVVELHGYDSATVTAGGRYFSVDLVATCDYVHAVAYTGGASAAHSCIAVARLSVNARGQGPDRPSAAARKIALETLTRVLRVAPAELTICCDGRDRRIPALCLGANRGLTALSLSHHGRFVAFACALPS